MWTCMIIFQSDVVLLKTFSDSVNKEYLDSNEFFIILVNCWRWATSYTFSQDLLLKLFSWLIDWLKLLACSVWIPEESAWCLSGWKGLKKTRRVWTLKNFGLHSHIQMREIQAKMSGWPIKIPPKVKGTQDGTWSSFRWHQNTVLCKSLEPSLYWNIGKMKLSYSTVYKYSKQAKTEFV